MANSKLSVLVDAPFLLRAPHRRPPSRFARCLPFAFAFALAVTKPRRRYIPESHLPPRDALLLNPSSGSIPSFTHLSAAMDEDRSADPARRGRLLSPTSGQPQTPPQTQPQLPMDLASQYQRRFAPSVFLPPMAPRLASSSGFSAFSNYQSLPTLAPAAGAAGSHLARSLPKPPLFSVDSLASLPYSTGPAAGAAVTRSPPSPGGSEQQVPSASGLPPRGAGHRRSRSDFLVGFSRPNQLPLPMTTPAAGEYKSRDASLEELFRSYRDPNLGASGSGDSKNERNDHLSSSQRVWSPADSSENEAESWAASGNGNADSSANHPRHCRSLSVDSIMSNLNFGGPGQVSLRLPPPSPVAVAGGSLSRTGTGASGGAVATSSELINGEFTESEMKKIMANDRLAEIALADPKRVKRFKFYFWSSYERIQLASI